MTRKPLDEDVTEDGLTVGKPKEWAAGVPAVAHSLEMAREEMGERSNTPTSKSIVVRLEPARVHVLAAGAAGSP